MADQEYVLMDTKSFDNVINQREYLIGEYEAINSEYDRIIETLLKNWEGRGASAFSSDARTVKTNIVGIFDILKLMCDTLTDCKAVFAECDKSLGDYNRNPDGQ